jgi:hypothetical protein
MSMTGVVLTVLLLLPARPVQHRAFRAGGQPGGRVVAIGTSAGLEPERRKEASMHRSRLCQVVIDCQDADLEKAGAFWAAALGRKVEKVEGRYAELEDRARQPLVAVQRVAHASRVHLDIESDDVEAEVARLEALGAKRLEKVRTWWVMEAPTGQRFCVVRPQRALGDDANTWE